MRILQLGIFDAPSLIEWRISFDLQKSVWV
jgi:hypothetical protein